MTSSSADWVFGGVRLISSASSRLVKTGPCAERERGGARVEDQRAGDVAGHQVGGELQALRCPGRARPRRSAPAASWPPRARLRAARGPRQSRRDHQAGDDRRPGRRPPWRPRRAAGAGRPGDRSRRSVRRRGSPWFSLIGPGAAGRDVAGRPRGYDAATASARCQAAGEVEQLVVVCRHGAVSSPSTWSGSRPVRAATAATTVGRGVSAVEPERGLEPSAGRPRAAPRRPGPGPGPAGRAGPGRARSRRSGPRPAAARCTGGPSRRGPAAAASSAATERAPASPRPSGGNTSDERGGPSSGGFACSRSSGGLSSS